MLAAAAASLDASAICMAKSATSSAAAGIYNAPALSETAATSVPAAAAPVNPATGIGAALVGDIAHVAVRAANCDSRPRLELSRRNKK